MIGSGFRQLLSLHSRRGCKTNRGFINAGKIESNTVTLLLLKLGYFRLEKDQKRVTLGPSGSMPLDLLDAAYFRPPKKRCVFREKVIK